MPHRRVCVAATVVSLALAGCGGSSHGSANWNPVAPSTPTTLPIWGACNQSPNYLGSVTLNRWERFPVTVSMNTPNLPDLPRNVWAVYAEGIRFAAANDFWRPPAAFQFTTDNPSAPIQVSVVNSDSDAAGAEGIAVATYRSVGDPQVITSASVRLIRKNSDLETVESLFTRGIWSAENLSRYISMLTLHELGHALGIRGHSTNSADIMSNSSKVDSAGNPSADYTKWVSPADLNTLSHAYCSRP